MGGSRRKYKKNRPKVRVALPRKKPGVFKPAFTIPEALLASADKNKEWDDAGGVIRNYKSFGVVSNPNLLGVRARTPQIVQCSSLQVTTMTRSPFRSLILWTAAAISNLTVSKILVKYIVFVCKVAIFEGIVRN